ncbi:MAG: glycosyltransferase family 9 protein [Negativicutes bacterium]|nr:glycosyltransferase family 9 protein [Negativicutes bacterium]
MPVEWRRILIVKLSAIGDVIHALPVATALRDQFPAARISWVVERPSYELICDHPALDEVIVFDKAACRRRGGLWRYAPGFVRGLRQRRFDLALDLQGLFKSAVIAWLSGAGVRYTVNHAREGAGWLCRPVPAGSSHIVDRYLDVARAAGCKADRARWQFGRSEDDGRQTDQLLASCGLAGRRVAVLVPGANWPNKRWPVENYARLAGELVRRGLAPLLAGGAGDRPLTAAIVSRAGGGVTDLAGRTSLRQLTGLLRRAALCVGGDTGPVHLAAAVGTPTVAILGPTDNRRNGPYGENSIGIEVPRDCAGCWRRRCPRQLDCLAAVSLRQVLEACEQAGVRPG